MADFSYMGKGRIFLGPFSGAGALREIGNCSKLEFAASEEKKEVADFTAAGGGKRNSLSRITGVTISISAYEFMSANLALALFGSASAVVAGAVVDEAHTAYKGGLIQLNNLPDPAVAPVVKNTAGTTTYVAGTDYEVVGAGIVVLSGGAIVDAQGLKISYTKIAGNLVQALTQSAGEYSLVFVGLNEFNSGRPVVVRAHRVKFGPLKNLSLIGDEAAQIELEGEVLSDSSITTPGLSKFFTVEMAA